MVVVDRESLVISLFKLIKHSWLCWLRFAYCGRRSFRFTKLLTTETSQALSLNFYTTKAVVVDRASLVISLFKLIKLPSFRHGEAWRNLIKD